MTDITTFKTIALSFNGTEHYPHFNRIAFKVTGKKIFATLDEKNETANIVLSKEDQDVYCSFDKDAVYPVPNKSGLQGWTTLELQKVPVELAYEAIYTAYKTDNESKRKRK